ncbi:MAG: CoA pyrophosphatase [Pseudomonadales bacterium]|nr:CoA pyrophosphatase [Pseudomonadales bacterium]
MSKTENLNFPANELSISFLRNHFLERQEPPPPPLYKDDSLLFKSLCEKSNKAAAVLIPIFDRPNGPELLLTRRADHLRSHAGQISFPGGRLEGAAETHIEAALREAQEEIGLPSDQVEVVGRLGDYYTISGFCVTPVIGLIQAPVKLTADPSEVAEIIHVPLNHLLRPDVFQLKEHQYNEFRRRYYSTYYEQHHIWGVTAGILMGLYQDILSDRS